VLYWLNMMAALEQPVDEIVRHHWERFGRSYFQRRDYFIADESQAADLMQKLTESIGTLKGQPAGDSTIDSADMFSYTDPVDGSVSKNQGIRIEFADGGRIVIRLSGTGTSGATMRIYLDKTLTEADQLGLDTSTALQQLAEAAAEIAQIEHFTGLSAPTAII